MFRNTLCSQLKRNSLFRGAPDMEGREVLSALEVGCLLLVRVSNDSIPVVIFQTSPRREPDGNWPSGE